LLGLELKALDQKYSGDIFKLQSNSWRAKDSCKVAAAHLWQAWALWRILNPKPWQSLAS
jgi:hypothetical protein